MMRNPHDEARELIAIAGTEGLSEARQDWLAAHVAQCAACRDYAEAAGRVIRGLRSLPVAADARLVRATQMRVRFHASRLREARERMWLIGIACVGVGFSAALSAPLLWRLFAWLGEWAGISSPIWQAGFIFFWVAPALVVSLLLLAGGTHLANVSKHSRQGDR
jgi:hypothetical protein